MRLILHYLKNYKLLLLLNILSVFGFALVELGIPTIISDMIDQGVTRQDQAYLMQMGLRIAVISVAGVCGTILLGYCQNFHFHDERYPAGCVCESTDTFPQ